jgi:hypothetical protein
MKYIFVIAASTFLIASSATRAESGARLHAHQSFTITLNAVPDVAVRAFGAVAEERWAPGFDPRFAYPNPPKDTEGAVFTLDGKTTQVWLLQRWDMTQHVVRYVAVDPGVKISAIDIEVAPLGANGSRATVTYDRTSLSPAGDAEVAAWAKTFAAQAPDWATAINGYLAESAR